VSMTVLGRRAGEGDRSLLCVDPIPFQGRYLAAALARQDKQCD
jgi:hypothetical protein